MKKRFSDEPIVGILKEGEAGIPVKKICRKYEISGALYPWPNKFGGRNTQNAHRLKQLEEENVNLKRILADCLLDMDALKVTFN
jgi:putative transposase